MKFTVFLFLLLVAQSFSLKCNQNFECNGNNDACNNIRAELDFNSNSQVKTCEAGEDRCGKADVGLRVSGLSINLKFSGCIPSSMCDRQQLEQSIQSIFDESASSRVRVRRAESRSTQVTVSVNKIECCTGDLCNSGFKKHFSILLLIGSLIFYLL